MKKNAGVPRSRIAEKAYELYLERGRADGCDVEDWLRAERLLQDQAAQQALPAGRSGQVRLLASARKRPTPQI